MLFLLSSTLGNRHAEYTAWRFLRIFYAFVAISYLFLLTFYIALL